MYAWFSRLLALLILALYASVLSAQTLRLQSTSPTPSSVGVPLNTTITLNFSEGIDSDLFSMENYGEYFVLLPMDKVVINTISFSSDTHQVIIAVTHQPNTDYTFAILDLQTPARNHLDKAYVFHYTTAAELAPFAINGAITFVNNPFMFMKSTEHALQQISYAFSVVLLFDNPDDLLSMGDGDGGPPPGIIKATTAHSESGAYQMPHLAPGTYYIAAFVFLPGDEGVTDSGAFGFYQDEHGDPLPVIVSDANVADINVDVFGFVPELLTPTDARAVWEMVHPQVVAQNGNLTLFAILGTHGSDFGWKSALQVTSTSTPPDGRSSIWQFVYVDVAAARVEIVFASATEIIHRMSLAISDIPEDEFIPVDISQVPMIPDDFVSSAAAFQTALQNGLSASWSEAARFENVYLDYELYGFWFEYPDHIEEGDAPFWAIRLDYGAWDFDVNGYRYTDIAYLVDAVTGDFIAEVITEGLDYPPPPDPLRIESVSPQPGSVEIPLLSEVTFTFTEPLDTYWFSMFMRGQSFQVYPSEKAEIRDSWFSEDRRTVGFEIMHMPDTDYTWVLTSPNSQHQQLIDQAYALRYTTATQWSSNQVSGQVHFVNRPPTYDKSVEPGSLSGGGSVHATDEGFLGDRFYAHSVVMLVHESVDLNQFKHQFPTQGVAAVAVLDSTTGSFTIPNVRNGTYKIIAYLLDNRFNQAYIYASGYLMTEQMEPVTLTVSDNNVTDVSMEVVGFRPDLMQPLTAHDARLAVGTRVSSLRPESELVRIEMIENRSMHHKTETGAAPVRDSTAPVREAAFPTGQGLNWTLLYYDTASDMVDRVELVSTMVVRHESFTMEGMDEHNKPPVPMESIPRLPAAFMNSHEALAVAKQNGLTAMLATIPSQSWMEVEYVLSGFWFEFPEVLNASSDPFWEVTLLSHYYPSIDAEMEFVEATYLINAVTGAFIHSIVVTAAEVDESLPTQVTLSQNWPNPFNPTTMIAFSLPELAVVRLAVFDITGRMVTVLTDGIHAAGEHYIPFNGGGLASGIYFYRLEVGGKAAITQKMTLLK